MASDSLVVLRTTSVILSNLWGNESIQLTARKEIVFH